MSSEGMAGDGKNDHEPQHTYHAVQQGISDFYIDPECIYDATVHQHPAVYMNRRHESWNGTACHDRTDYGSFLHIKYPIYRMDFRRPRDLKSAGKAPPMQ
jgi:hypothetical protein